MFKYILEVVPAASHSNEIIYINHSANPGNSYETLESTTLVANLVGILVMELVL